MAILTGLRGWRAPGRLVTLAALLGPNPAWAEWRLVSDDGFSKIYVESESRKALPNGVVAVSALTDYDPNSPQAKDFGLAEKGLSEIESVSIDCPRRLYKSNGGNWFKEHMGRGEISKNYGSVLKWTPVPDYYNGLAAEICPLR